MTIHLKNLLSWRWLLAMAAMVFWIYWERERFHALVAGPSTLLLGKTTALTDLGELGNRYVKVEGGETRTLFARTHTLGKQPYSTYTLLQHEGQLLLVCLPGDHEGNAITGVLQPLSRFEKDHILPNLKERHPGKTIMPYRLNAATPYRQSIVFSGAILGVFLVILAVWSGVPPSPRG